MRVRPQWYLREGRYQTDDRSKSRRKEHTIEYTGDPKHEDVRLREGAAELGPRAIRAVLHFHDTVIEENARDQLLLGDGEALNSRRGVGEDHV